MKSGSVQTDIPLEMTGPLIWVGRFTRDVKHYELVSISIGLVMNEWTIHVSFLHVGGDW